uniref:Uncharacterized protein n=1 Tax=Moniliophthora roreri TaxID=221103 RepID=A0A0W0FAI1_MONRR
MSLGRTYFWPISRSCTSRVLCSHIRTVLRISKMDT